MMNSLKNLPLNGPRGHTHSHIHTPEEIHCSADFGWLVVAPHCMSSCSVQTATSCKLHTQVPRLKTHTLKQKTHFIKIKI